jgi:hypothetical protein
LQGKWLVERVPLRPLGEPERYLLVTPEIDALSDGHVLYGVFPAIRAETLIGIFAAGQLVTVSRRITKTKPDIEQIVGADEVWALCLRRPRPGWRFFGRWHKQGVFIALRAWEKGKLAQNYSNAAQEVIDDWRHLLREEPVHTGASVEDYVGGVHRDVDQDP